MQILECDTVGWLLGLLQTFKHKLLRNKGVNTAGVKIYRKNSGSELGLFIMTKMEENSLFYVIVLCIYNIKTCWIQWSGAPCCKPYSLYCGPIVLKKKHFYEILQILVIPRLHCSLHQTSLLTPTKFLYSIQKSS